MYEHTQRGSVVWGGIVVTVLVLVVALGRAGESAKELAPVMLIVMGVLALTGLILGSLTTRVSREQVEIKMGIGLIRRTFPVKNIHGARTVRNKWFYGWGIRLTPTGWMFNVAGLDAVLLEMKDGTHFRIGTDEPERLLRAVERVLQSRKA